jgi:hypothetical protein
MKVSIVLVGFVAGQAWSSVLSLLLHLVFADAASTIEFLRYKMDAILYYNLQELPAKEECIPLIKIDMLQNSMAWLVSL